MKFTIRETHEGDIKAIQEIVETREYDDVNWLYSAPGMKGKYSSFVAVNEDDKVIGVIGYTICNYYYNSQKFSGIIPKSWYIIPEYRGLTGVQLLIKIMKLADFGFAIEGSETAINTYRIAKLDYKYDAYIYYKIFKPCAYFLTEHRNSFSRICKTLYLLRSYLRKAGRTSIKEDVSLIKYKPGDKISNDYASKVLYNKESSEHIKWLLDCPVVDSFAFYLMVDKKILGVVVCYIRKFNNNTKRGRIVHIPYLGKDLKLWQRCIELAEDFLRKEGCSSVTVFANNGDLLKSLKDSGYIRDIHKKPVFIRDDKKLLDHVPVRDWHLTFYESDKGYRNI